MSRVNHFFRWQPHPKSPHGSVTRVKEEFDDASGLVTRMESHEYLVIRALHISNSFSFDDAHIYQCDPPDMVLENICEHCGRGDWFEVPPQTFEGAIEHGWLVELEKVQGDNDVG